MKGKGYLEVKDFGILEIIEEEDGISSINFVEKVEDSFESDEVKNCIQQLKEYFLGNRREFDIKLDIRIGTEFQQKALKALTEIPYGETRSYQEQAIAIGNPKAVRAVGGANNKNPISIIIPCHRVIGKNNKLVGYGGGLLKKEFLLNLEKQILRRGKMEFNLKNNEIEIRVESKGAELTGIKDLVTGQEYVWQKDPKFWAKSSPVLFPFVGAIKEDRYFYNGKEYNITTKHGFARDNEFNLSSQGEDYLEFVFESNEETRKIYPFDFKFFIKYIIKGKTVKIEYRVENLTDGDMYFSLGAHPAFNTTTDENIKVTDYYIEFEKEESGEVFELNGALISSKGKIKFFEGNRIDLERDRFINDAAIIENPNSKVVWLKNNKNNSGVKFEYEGFKYIAFWNVPGADYVCFEPWNGISDYDNASGELTEKIGIEKLEKGGKYTRELNITIF